MYQTARVKAVILLQVRVYSFWLIDALRKGFSLTSLPAKNMWTCLSCGQNFIRINQVHSCGDKVLADFLKGKSDHTLGLFWHLVDSFQEFGDVTIHPTKSMIAFAAKTRIAYVIHLGRNFVDIVFPFDKPHMDNLCFQKIAQVPGTEQYNHHLRIEEKDDVNKEVKLFMRKAFKEGS